MQKYEDNKEKTEEDTLQIQLTELIDLVDNAKYYEENKMIEALSKMVELYEKQKESGLDFNEKDMILRKKQLAEIKYEKLKREHIESKESESWNEFEKDEEQEDKIIFRRNIGRYRLAAMRSCRQLHRQYTANSAGLIGDQNGAYRPSVVPSTGRKAMASNSQMTLRSCDVRNRRNDRYCGRP